MRYGAVVESYAERRLVVRLHAGDMARFDGCNVAGSTDVTVAIDWQDAP